MPKLFLFACFSLILSACAQQPTTISPSTTNHKPTATPVQTADEPTEDESIERLINEDPEAVSQLLDVYLTQAKASEDPELISQAARFAMLVGRPDNVLDMTQLWLSLQADNPEAWHAQTLAHLILGDKQALTNDLHQLIKVNPDSGLDRLLTDAAPLSDGLFYGLIDTISTLVKDFPNDPRFWFAKALHYQQQNDLSAALDACDRLLAIDPNHIAASRLKAQLLEQSGDTKQALRTLADLQKHYPENADIAADHTRLLLGHHKWGAKRAVIRFNKQFPSQQELRLLLAVASLQAGFDKPAMTVLQSLAEEKFNPDNVQYLIAQLYEKQQQYSRAIQHYLKVPGDNQLNAGVAAANLYYQIEQPEQANALYRQLRRDFPQQAALLYTAEAALLAEQPDQNAYLHLLNDALTAFPTDANLLYMRAMSANDHNDFTAMETDLRTLISHHPRHIDALNSLAYTLINHTRKQQEAWYYAKRAHSLAPDNAAIQDTLGWVLFHLDQYNEALGLLQQAYAAEPDPEVASHLVTILRTMDRPKQAQEVLTKATKKFPDSAFLLSLPLP